MLTSITPHCARKAEEEEASPASAAVCELAVSCDAAVFGFDCHQMFAGAERCRGHGGEILRVDNALDIQSGGRDPIIGQQCAGHFSQAGLRLIADTGDIGDWQTARLHAHIDHDVGGLADQRDTTVN